MFYFTVIPYHGPNKLHLRGTFLDVVSLPSTSLANLLGALYDEMALVSTNKTLAVLWCSAPDQALAVRRLERCACRPVTPPRRPCTTWDMVIISDSSFALRSPIAVLNSSREGTFDPPSLLPTGGSSMLSAVVFRSLGS